MNKKHISKKIKEEQEIHHAPNNKNTFITIDQFHKKLNEFRVFNQKITNQNSKLTVKIEKMEKIALPLK